MTVIEARKLMDEADEVRHVDPMTLNPKGNIHDRIMRYELLYNSHYSFVEDGQKILVLVSC